MLFLDESEAVEAALDFFAKIRIPGLPDNETIWSPHAPPHNDGKTLSFWQQDVCRGVAVILRNQSNKTVLFLQKNEEVMSPKIAEDCPPIPPNCPYFEAAFGLPCFRIYDELIFVSLKSRNELPNRDKDYHILDAYNSPFVVGVCAEAWRKEAWRFPPTGMGVLRDVREIDALKNAAAWIELGESYEN